MGGVVALIGGTCGPRFSEPKYLVTSALVWATGQSYRGGYTRPIVRRLTRRALLGAALALPSHARIARLVFPPLMMLSAAPYFITGMLLLYVLAFRRPRLAAR